MKIKAKIFFGFLIIVILLILGATISVVQFIRLNNTNKELLYQNHKSVETIAIMHEAFELYDYGVLSLLTDSSNKAQDIFYSADSLYSVFIYKSSELSQTTEESVLLSEFKIDFEHFRYEWIINFSETPDFNHYLHTKTNEFRVLRKSLNNLMLAFQHKILNDSNNLFEQTKRTLTPSIITIFASLLLILLINFFFNKYFLFPIIAINKAINKFKINKKYNVEIETKDEMADLSKSIEELTNEIIRKS